MPTYGYESVLAVPTYGCDELCLFMDSLDEDSVAYADAGANDYYMQANMEALHMGMSEGHYGLWLDQSLTHGLSSKVATFNNQPLATHENFNVRGVEVWRMT